ncbi:MAG TPA: curli-like amyloid fiber formation chaperone CsgH [Burkholderiales bacterium]
MPDAISKIRRGLRAALFFPVAVLLFAQAGVAITQSTVEAWLETTPIEGRLKITAYARGGPHASARYELLSEKSGASGKSSTRQAGAFNLKCCDPVALSNLSLGLKPGDRYVITLRLLEGDTLLAEKILSYPQ